MPRFFSGEPADGTAAIVGEDARHIALSLRMKTGDEITLCHDGADYRCRLTDITPERVECEIIEVSDGANEPNVFLRLFQAVPKGEKAEIIIQKSVELGVSEINFVMTSRCISRPDEKSFKRKLTRYNRIALEAAKQSERCVVPQVNGILTLDEAIGEMKKCGTAVWCYEKGGVKFSELSLKPNSEIGLLIGSEGGFSDEEARLLKSSGFTPVGMGRRILRCETAPLAAAAIIMNLTGNM